MRKVFISYHHANDQWAKDQLQQWASQYELFEDVSVNTRDIEGDLPTETIRCIIRDEYLRDSTVTIVLVGTETRGRKHVDWEIYSSMRDGPINKKSGILVIQLPSTSPTSWHAAHAWEKSRIYPDCDNWISLDSWDEYQRRHPYLPDRIIDNLMAPNATISVTNWARIENDLESLAALIEAAHQDRLGNEYDFSRPMRKANSPTG
ncbi:TIR domain-containing protein [Altererythrobacter sp. Z27]|uniref:TIR domain-containing protein n=1 Tax=Altererythrobacter sp. Z27 TaxID=3461147 RepID=UPI004044BB49